MLSRFRALSFSSLPGKACFGERPIDGSLLKLPIPPFPFSEVDQICSTGVACSCSIYGSAISSTIVNIINPAVSVDTGDGNCVGVAESAG